MNRDGSQVPAGAITRYSVGQAVSALAHDVEDVDRANELEALAGELVGIREAVAA